MRIYFPKIWTTRVMVGFSFFIFPWFTNKGRLFVHINLTPICTIYVKKPFLSIRLNLVSSLSHLHFLICTYGSVPAVLRAFNSGLVHVWMPKFVVIVVVFFLNFYKDALRLNLSPPTCMYVCIVPHIYMSDNVRHHF